MKEKLKKFFISKHPRSTNSKLIMFLTAIVILLTVIFSWPIFNSLLDSFSERTLMAAYAIMLAVIVAVGFTFASLTNFKDNAEYYSVKGRKRAFLIECALSVAITLIVWFVIGTTLVPFFDFLYRASY